MNAIRRNLFRIFNNWSMLLLFVTLVISLGCEEGTAQSPGTGGTPPQPGASQKESLIDACSLLTKEEVEQSTGRRVLNPMQANVANLATCYFGNLDSPIIHDRPIDTVVTVSLMVGIEGQYYAGAVAQVRDTYEMARKNASSAQVVENLGEAAYWDDGFKSINVLQGKYMLGVEVSSDAGGIDVAKDIATKILPKLR